MVLKYTTSAQSIQFQALVFHKNYNRTMKIILINFVIVPQCLWGNYPTNDISSRLSILSWDTVGDSNAGLSPEFLQQHKHILR